MIGTARFGVRVTTDMEITLAHNSVKTNRERMRKLRVARKLFGVKTPSHVMEIGVGSVGACHLSPWIGFTRVTLVDANPYCAAECIRYWRDAITMEHCAVVACPQTHQTVQLIVPEGTEKPYGPAFVEGVEGPAWQQGRGKKWTGRITVPAKTMPAIDNGSIELLSLDCEGSEFAVLRSMVSRPRLIYAEMQQPGAINAYTAAILKLLGGLGYVRRKELELRYDWCWVLEAL